MDIDEDGNMYLLTYDKVGPLYYDVVIRIKKFGPDGFPLMVVDVDSLIPFSEENLNPIRVDHQGNIIISFTDISHVSYVYKFSPLGVNLWSWQYNRVMPQASDRIRDMEVDDDGNVIISYKGTVAVPYYDSYKRIVKFDPSGTMLWDTTPHNLGAVSWWGDLLFDDDGGYFSFYGFEDSLLPYDVVSRIANDGTILWTQITTGKDAIYGTVDRNKNLILAYLTNNNIPWHLEKRDSTGTILWDVRANQTNVLKLISDNQGYTYLIGKGAAGILVSKYSPQGNEVWNYEDTSHTNASTTYPVDAKIAGRSIYVYGIQEGNTSVVDGPNRSFLIKMDSSGQVISEKYNGLHSSSMVAYSHFMKMSEDHHIWTASSPDRNHSYVVKTCAGECDFNLTGKAYSDANTNCVQEQNEEPIRHQVIWVPASQTFVLTDSLGDYRMHRRIGQIDFDLVRPSYWNNSCQNGPYSIQVTAANYFQDSLDFALHSPGVNDLSVSVAQTPARRGFIQNISVHYRNVGSTVQNGNLELQIDSNATFLQASVLPDSIVGDRMYWDLRAVPVWSEGGIYVEVVVDTFAILGSAYSHHAYISPTLNDYTPADNHDSLPSFIVGSFDPNEKSVVPAGEGEFGITDFQVQPCLNYLIQFQNTGNDTAFTVAIRDTIDPNLDLSGFVMGAASHPYHLELSENRVLTWVFNSILLPDSNTNEPNSHGFLRYSLPVTPGLQYGATVSNRAAIYFDFNLPIFTGTTLNTYGQVVSSQGFISKDRGLRIYPNPSSEYIWVDFETVQPTRIEFEVWDTKGRILHRGILPSKASGTRLSISELPAGIYLLKLNDGRRKGTGRFVKM